jgi:hypothetical protein
VVCHLTALEEAEIIPVKDSNTRIKPLALTNGRGRYMAVTPERALVSVGGCPLNIYIAVKCFFRSPFGGFRSETGIWTQKWFKKSVGASRVL